jgi:hypothetical protein
LTERDLNKVARVEILDPNLWHPVDYSYEGDLGCIRRKAGAAEEARQLSDEALP